MRTTACDEASAVVYDFLRRQVDVAIAAHGVRHTVGGFRKGGRVENNYVKLFVFVAVLSEQIENVGFQGSYVLLSV